MRNDGENCYSLILPCFMFSVRDLDRRVGMELSVEKKTSARNDIEVFSRCASMSVGYARSSHILCILTP